MYTCASCTIHGCSEAEPERIPANCPMRNREMMKRIFKEYEKPEVHAFYVTCSEIEALGYGQWSRLEETIQFCSRMQYRKIGLAFCRGLRREAKTVEKVLRIHGFEVVSVICKVGGISKEQVGISEEHKLHPGEFEPMCNPMAQAALLNEQKTEFNIALGLCVGHDSVFYRNSEAYVTTLVAKDRVMAHNPCGAIYTAEGYYKTRLGL